MIKDKRIKKIECGAVILAGGDSKRLGQPKALLEFGEFSLIEMMVENLKELFTEITVITDRPLLYRDLPVLIKPDLLIDGSKSPLRGIHAGLSTSTFPCQFVAACDMPFLNKELIKYMSCFASDYDAVVPRVGEYFQPLHAFYSQKCIDIIAGQILAGDFKVTNFYANLNIRYIESEEIRRFDPEELSFVNINTWPDYEQARKVMAGKLKNGGKIEKEGLK